MISILFSIGRMHAIIKQFSVADIILLFFDFFSSIQLAHSIISYIWAARSISVRYLWSGHFQLVLNDFPNQSLYYPFILSISITGQYLQQLWLNWWSGAVRRCYIIRKDPILGRNWSNTHYYAVANDSNDIDVKIHWTSQLDCYCTGPIYSTCC